MLASGRNLLVLDNWLQNRIVAGQDIFVRACLDYLTERIVNDARQSTPASKELTVETISTFLQVLLGR